MREDSRPALEVTASFRGGAMNTRILDDPTGALSPPYRVGSGAGVDAPADPALLESDPHALVSATGADFIVSVAPGMSGDVCIDGLHTPLAELVAVRGARFSLPQGAEAHLSCGSMTFTVRAITRPPLIKHHRRDRLYGAGLLLLFIVAAVVPFLGARRLTPRAATPVAPVTAQPR